MTTMLIKVTDVQAEAVWDAMEALVDEHGASFYTLVVNDAPQRVDAHSVHLAYESYEAALYAHACATMEAYIKLGGTMPQEVADALARVQAFEQGAV